MLGKCDPSESKCYHFALSKIVQSIALDFPLSPGFQLFWAVLLPAF